MHPRAPRRPAERARHCLLVASAVLAASGLVTVLVPDPASAATRPVSAIVHSTHLDITSTTGQVESGQRALIRGALTAAERGDRRVSVEQRAHGARSWSLGVAVRTDASGRFVLRTSVLRRSTDFRLRVQDGARTLTSAITTVTVATSLTVTASSPRTSTAGSTVVLAGTSTGPLAGARIFLQVDRGPGWTTISSSEIFSDGTFNVQAIATAGGDQSYRVMVPATDGYAEAVSSPRTFTVRAWYRLADLNTVEPFDDADTPLVKQDVALTTGWFEQGLGAALASGGSAVAAWDLGGRCSSVQATVGLATGADTAAIGRWRLLADDDSAVDVAAGPGSDEPVSATITGADRLELRSFVSGGAGDAAWGDAEVLCAGRP